MKPNTKANIYGFANAAVWLALSAAAVALIFHFLSNCVLIAVLSFAAVVGSAYFEEMILSRIVNRIVAFFLRDKI